MTLSALVPARPSAPLEGTVGLGMGPSPRSAINGLNLLHDHVLLGTELAVREGLFRIDTRADPRDLPSDRGRKRVRAVPRGAQVLHAARRRLVGLALGV